MNISKNIWLPYCQMKNLKEPPLEVVSGNRCSITLKDGTKLIDGISSWWCMIHGYNHPKLNNAIKTQVNKISHVMLGGLSSSVTKEFANKLIEITPKKLKHVFFGDSGSVGVEISLKMALQYWQNKKLPKKTKFIAYKNSYHGDTSACMSVCDPVDGMHKLFKGLIPKQFFISTPIQGFQASSNHLKGYADNLEKLLKENHQKIAGLIIEPILQCAGGFHIHSPKYLQTIQRLCKKYDVLVIYDEVATGFGRTGKLFALEHARGVCPDILVLGKALTGGYIGHSATLSSSKVFKAFYVDDSNQSFMHGPTFMGNPLACAVGLKSIEIFQNDSYLEKVKKIEMVLKEEFHEFNHPQIEKIQIIGAVVSIITKNNEVTNGFQQFAKDHGIWLRPFERYIYSMPPLVITTKELRKICSVMKEWFNGKK